ncbi:LOW QUALITY PROTEIN: protein LURP-one-related 17 [Raphanus sativus]|uniref:LOW QUALITY PROTEIN: protein LURP-one-related 17 n=1 Tax=Raphanus sativus TaxID=3726 RepID=A0A6J0M740_RAPSA|nr:LOW QUALITY PROTEIN: protein LURP-one-related 17 [Raphanus sativus]
MFPFLKHRSRSVHGDDELSSPEKIVAVTSTVEIGDACTTLTVWRKSLLVSCEGFTVIDSNGDLIYRVDNYARTRPEELILMDKDGNSVLLMHRTKKITLVDSWGIYEVKDTNGEAKVPKSPLWYMRKNLKMNILSTNSNILAYVFSVPFDKKNTYVIKGSYRCKSCKIMHVSSNRAVVEIKRKEARTKGVRFGSDVFDLVVSLDFDTSLAMALVLLLDQMFSK